MERKLLEARWRSFADVVLPKGIDRVQRQETRRAFYAGAQAFYAVMMQNLETGEEPTENDEAMLEGMVSELREFVASVSEGEA